jgi:hypothetical protein
MKKPELYRILCDGRVIYKDLTEDELFDVMDELSEQFYQKGLPKPDDLVVEFIGTPED